MNLRHKFVFTLLVCLGALPGIAAAASPNIVISQVYGAGGNSGASLRNDYIELFNRGTSPVTVTGWSVQYSSSTGTGLFSSNVTNLSGTINPGQYYLVQESSGGTNGALLPAADASGGIAMAAGAGKVVLVNTTTGLACNGSSTVCSPAQLAQIVDLVGYGTGTNYFEGSGPTATTTTTNAAFRKSNGCTDTDNNASDFALAAAAPRNTATAAAPCGGGNNAPAINNPANPIATVTQDAAPFTVNVTGTDDNNVFNWSATAGTGIASVTVSAGQGTASVTYNVTLQAGFSGTASFTASLSDNVNAAVTKTVNIQVNPLVVNNPPTITLPANPIATVAQDAAPFTVSLDGFDDNASYNWSATTGSGVSSAVVTAGQGTANATYTVTLQSGFSGTATFTASLSDGVNAAATRAVNITVTPAPPPPLDHLVISQIYGGGGNSGATYHNDFVELYNPTTGAIDTGGWTIQYASSTGTTWQAQPLGGVIQPGEYYLIALASGGAPGAALPAANVSGDINMSGTTGKVALSSGGDPLDGCPIGDPTLVDLVGYGTANCREGAANAAAPSNTIAIFRKNGGFTDTNVNSADFQTGAPNPRRTTPIVEIGPYVLNVDPRANAFSAPRDASLSVTFTEPVEVTGAWFNISCPSGLHNDATVASGSNGRLWIITPNTNFVAGEQCTVTIDKNLVHDADLDDSGPNSDTLSANYSWSFSVSTGTAPPYPADVHLTFGNPSNAANDLFTPNNYLMEKPEFALSYNRDKGTPNWVSWHLTDEWVGSLTRVDTFRPDPQVPADWYRVLHIDYQNSGFDRGHMTPNADRDKETSTPINQATFLMSNMVPQAPDNNQGPWANLENALRALLPANELYIVAGPAGVGGTGSSGFMTTIANGHVTVPSSTWKCALVLPKQSGDDVARVTASTRTICVIMPNVQGIRNNDWHIYLTSVDQVEALSGYDLFANVSDAVENAIEAGVDGVNPPGVADQSISTNEDSDKTFTLDAVSASANPLTYTIVAGPAHGSLSGSGASRTYTPAPDFNGTDRFTFRVSDGSLTSNTATMTITVLEVNDAPTASNDSATTNEDTPLVIAASDLTSNDSAGPANESGQTLTVTSVSANATLSGGQITYVPAANYNGPASFTYQVCDNGVTTGLTSPLCTTATVDINVAPVNDAPTVSIAAPSTSPEGSPVTATATAADVDGDSLTYAWSVTKNGSPYATSPSFTPDDNGVYVVTVTVNDGNATATASATVNVTNVAPVITSVSGPTSAITVGTTATINAGYTDAGAGDTHTATFTWSDGATSTAPCAGGTCTGTRTFTAAGIYGVTILVSDDDAGTASAAFNSVIVTDANAGFVTGGGWIDTPAGKATLNLDAKYQKNAATPTGNTQFKVTGFDLRSTSLDWLVVSGANAQYQGTGTLNGTGAYGFVIAVTDGDADTFSIRIWNKSNGTTVYETATPQSLGGGSIVIHH